MADQTRIIRRRIPLLPAQAAVLSLAVVLVSGLLQACSMGYEPLSIAAFATGGPVAMAQAQGLVLTLRIMPGPYFLGELVASEMTLTNTAATTYTLAGSPGATVCDSALSAALSGGQPPTYTLPTTGFVSCPLIESTLTPRATWVTDELFPLTASGDITLTAQTSFITSSTSEGMRNEQVTNGPFAAAPAIHISVAPASPPAKAIVLHLSRQSQSPQVTVDAPPAARWSLYSIYDVICQDPPGASEEPGIAWQPLADDTFDEPGCPGSDEVWRYSVGAPGYEIASGTYS